MEKMTKREFTDLHRSGAIGLLHAGPGTIEQWRANIAEALEKSGRDMKSYLRPLGRPDIDGSDTTIQEDHERGIIYVYTSSKRRDGVQTNYATIYGRHN